VAAGFLLLIALVLPWNLYFGVGIPGSRGEVYAVLLVATVLSLVSIVATQVGRMSGPRFNPSPAERLRLALNIPYLLLVVGFVLFDLLQAVRYGGSAYPPGGVGPGAWLGIAGSLLSAQPPIVGASVDNDRFRGWLLSARIVGYASVVVAVLSVAFNLFWRTKAALPSASSGFGKQNVAVIATAVVYGAVALVAVCVASRWVVQRSKASRLAATALGASTLVAGLTVWSLPIGREIDGFHGIAQNTSTAGVGFEGYLAWAAAAAILAAPTLIWTVASQQFAANIWRSALRKGLSLIAVWCVGSVVMRITDLIITISLDLPYSPYNSAAMAAFDLFTATIAVWLHINFSNRSLAPPVISLLCGVLFVLSVSRVVTGIALAPRIAGPPVWLSNPVFGNDLAQQITSIFDVVLCVLTVGILAVVLSGRSQRRPHVGPPQRASQSPPSSAPQTTRPGTGGAPRIFRGGSDSTRRPAVGAPKIYRPSDNST
jgi:hypothetical protein